MNGVFGAATARTAPTTGAIAAAVGGTLGEDVSLDRARPSRFAGS